MRALEQPEAEVSIHVALADYLRKLELSELDKPRGQRRTVPTITELAEAAGISRVAMSNLANDNLQSVNLKTLSVALNELRRRGFDAQLTDLLTTYPQKSMQGK
ncbi:MAG: helix-turn-helix transcriptional regulator [Chloroflexota bacterium]|nr:helix-turn-helix transcriptional regulator [Chloroflexota bacterium]